MLSVIVLSRNERFALTTCQDILSKASGDIECLLVMDGRADISVPSNFLDDKRQKLLYWETPIGMRSAINAGMSASRGDFVMKLDGHCLVAPGFDTALMETCEEDWVVVPRRYSLNAELWQVEPKRPVRDYHYLCYPDPNKKHDGGMHGVEWPEKTRERQGPAYDLDDTPCLQGSCWLMSRKHWDKIGGLHEGEVYGTSGMAGEPVEICLKTWLSGGRVVINKKTWYAHLHKGKAYGRGYNIDDKSLIPGQNSVASYWVNNQEPNMKHKFSWLINDKFPDMPTWWPDWEEKLRDMGVIHD